MGLDDTELDSSQDIGLEMNGGDDDDIIDLEDIVEMPVGSIDEDEDLEVDVEILDAEADLDFDLLERKIRVEEAPPRDLPKDFSTLHDELEKPAPAKAPAPPKAEEIEEDLLDKLIASELERQAAPAAPAAPAGPRPGRPGPRTSRAPST
jgi:hypothetical protein